MRHNGARSPDEILNEMERTRADMDTTLTAIEQRLSPGQLFDQGLAYLRSSGGSEFFSNLGESARQNPMPVTLAGIGLAWLMASSRQGGEGIAAGATAAGGTIHETIHRAGEKARQARTRIDSMVHEQPLALGAVGLALGALLAACTPRARAEDRLTGEARELGATSEPARSAAKAEDTPATAQSTTQPRRQK